MECRVAIHNRYEMQLLMIVLHALETCNKLTRCIGLEKSFLLNENDRK